MREQIICTICPLGCGLEVEFESKQIVSVKGNRCRRGIPYAEKEIINPERVLTTTVGLANGNLPLLPVKTNISIPRNSIMEVMKETAKLIVRAPIRAGDCIVRNISGTDADLIATRTVFKKEKTKDKKAPDRNRTDIFSLEG